MAIFYNQQTNPGASSIAPRLIVALFIAGASFLTYISKTTTNPVTGKKQHISMSAESEVALGLQEVPEMARQFGGFSPDQRGTSLVERVGSNIVDHLPSSAGHYSYEFHLLADTKTINAFALPGGQVFITAALLSRLGTEGQLAGVLGHEVGHVVGRHSAERMAKAELTQGLVGAATVASSDRYSGQRSAQMIAGMVGNFINLSYSRDDELEADRLGLKFMAAAGYDPTSMIDVMQILKSAQGGGSQPQFMSTHPDPGNRIEKIKEDLAKDFASGVPRGLVK